MNSLLGKSNRQFVHLNTQENFSDNLLVIIKRRFKILRQGLQKNHGCHFFQNHNQGTYWYLKIC